MAKFVSRTHMAARCTDCSCVKPTPMTRSESCAAYSISQNHVVSSSSTSSSRMSISKQQLASEVQAATAPVYASCMNVPSCTMLPSTAVTLCRYAPPAHAASCISSMRYSDSARHEPVPHGWVMMVPYRS